MMQSGFDATNTPRNTHDFRLEGEYWTIAYEGRVCRLKDRVGLQHLAHLLANPGREILAFDLVRARARCTAAVALPPPARDAGVVLDDRARAEYRERLRDLRDELERAIALDDGERAARVQAESDFIAREFARSIGLRGRPRRAGSSVERARVSVTRAIQDAIRRITVHHPALGRHLDVTVRTGTFCAYHPDPRVPIAWST